MFLKYRGRDVVPSKRSPPFEEGGQVQAVFASLTENTSVQITLQSTDTYRAAYVRLQSAAPVLQSVHRGAQSAEPVLQSRPVCSVGNNKK